MLGKVGELISLSKGPPKVGVSNIRSKKALAKSAQRKVNNMSINELQRMMRSHCEFYRKRKKIIWDVKKFPGGIEQTLKIKLLFFGNIRDKLEKLGIDRLG